MGYLTAKEISELWNIDISQVGKMARSGRLPGAKQIGRRWMIPSNTPRPTDARTKAGKSKEPSQDTFRFPSFINFDVDDYDPPLSQEELQLRKVQLLFNECLFEQAKNALGDLPLRAANRYVRINALYFACLLTALEADKINGYEYIKALNLEFAEDFPYKNEMLFFLSQLDAALGGRKLVMGNYKPDSGYAYHNSAIPNLITMCIYSTCITYLDQIPPDPSIYELNCLVMERNGYYAEAQLIHLCLGFLWFFKEENARALEHIRQVLLIAANRHLYWIPAMYYLFCADAYERLFPEFDQAFTGHLTELGKELYQRYLRFAKKESLTSIYGKLLRRDIQLVYSAMKNYPNKKIAALMNLSEATISNRYTELFERLGVRNKKSIRDQFSQLTASSLTWPSKQ